MKGNRAEASPPPPAASRLWDAGRDPRWVPIHGVATGPGPCQPGGDGHSSLRVPVPSWFGDGFEFGAPRAAETEPNLAQGRQGPELPQHRAAPSTQGPRGASWCWGRSVFSAGIAPNPASKRLNGNISPLASRGRLGSAGKRARKEGGRGEKGEFGFLSVPSLRQKKPFFSPKLPPAEQSEVTRQRAWGRTAPSNLRTGPGNRPRGSES